LKKNSKIRFEEVIDMARVLIPAPLQRLTGGASEVNVDAKTVSGLIDALEERYSGVKERLLDEEGKIRRFINIFVNGEDIRFLADKETEIKPEDEVSIVPAIAGG
jgi:molybdopterin synthase sulfur carrier subunit